MFRPFVAIIYNVVWQVFGEIALKQKGEYANVLTDKGQKGPKRVVIYRYTCIHRS
jgi:hypothetical protein